MTFELAMVLFCAGQLSADMRLVCDLLVLSGGGPLVSRGVSLVVTVSFPKTVVLGFEVCLVSSTTN